MTALVNMETPTPSIPPAASPSPMRRMLGAWEDRRVRYVVVGVFNTASSFLVLWAVFAIAGCRGAARADKASQTAVAFSLGLIVNAVNITVSFATQKLLVFRTRGNYLVEFLRFNLVYAVPSLCGASIFAFLVGMCGVNKYVASALITAGFIVLGYVAHSRFSFRSQRKAS